MTAENDSIDLVDRLVGEYADRLARDEDPRREELLAQAPRFRAELERCFRMLDGVGESAGPTTLAAGLELGDYRLGRVLGRGGMALVYEAEEKSLRRRVALKVLRHHLTLDEKQLERFQREARAAARLRHANVVPIHAVGRVDGHAFIAFELVTGPTLAQVIDALAARGVRPSAADLARTSGQNALASAPSYAEACVRHLTGVFAAVEHAHAQGIIHRDLKPSNVLLTSEGKPLVADFGLAKDLGEASLSLTGETIGTPHYMAPEQAGALAKRVDARTDVYSLGVTLYELLTLRRPFEGHTLQELVQSITTTTPRSPTELAPDVPERLGDVVLKAMAKTPLERYASVAAFAADLERARSGAAVQARPAHGMTALFGGWFQAQIQGLPFEYRSKHSLFGWPWIHVVSGVRDPRTNQPRWAKGVIACGDYAVGVYAAGKLAFGLVALGMLAFGPVAIGALAFGWNAMGGLVFGWDVTGAMVAGFRGRGMLSQWVLHPERPDLAGAEHALHGGPPPAFLVAVVLAVLAPTFFHGIWRRSWPAEEHRRFLRWVTSLWMPLAYLVPLGLSRAGLELPLMGHLVVAMGITAIFATLVTLRLGAPKQG